MGRPSLKVKLEEGEREFLTEFIRKGNRKAREIARANILLLADEDHYDTDTISEVLKVSRQRVWRTKKRYIEEGLQAALEERERPGQPKKYEEEQEAEVIATACTSPPKGRKRWSIRLLTQELKNRGLNINHESVRLILKKAKLNLG